jgi:hypothetical protein
VGGHRAVEPLPQTTTGVRHLHNRATGTAHATAWSSCRTAKGFFGLGPRWSEPVGSANRAIHSLPARSKIQQSFTTTRLPPSRTGQAHLVCTYGGGLTVLSRYRAVLRLPALTKATEAAWAATLSFAFNGPKGALGGHSGRGPATTL